MKKRKFQKDCTYFEELIKEGKKISEGSRSIRGHGNYISNAEQRAQAWYIKARNFISELFGENFRDLNTFKNCFGKYTQMSILTESYMGSVQFVKEDMEKGIGVLEGMYSSFKDKRIKRRSKIKIFLINLYYEIKDWGKIAGGSFKKIKKNG